MPVSRATETRDVRILHEKIAECVHLIRKLCAALL